MQYAAATSFHLKRGKSLHCYDVGGVYLKAILYRSSRPVRSNKTGYHHAPHDSSRSKTESRDNLSAAQDVQFLAQVDTGVVAGIDLDFTGFNCHDFGIPGELRNRFA